MTPTRQELEREVLSLKDRLEVALSAAACARNIMARFVSDDVKKGGEYKRLFAFVTAVADESSMATPFLAQMGWQEGMKEARILAEEVSGPGDVEWRAGLRRLIEEIDRKLKK